MQCDLVSLFEEEHVPDDVDIIKCKKIKLGMPNFSRDGSNIHMQSPQFRQPIVLVLTQRTGPREFASHLTNNYPVLVTITNMSTVLLYLIPQPSIVFISLTILPHMQSADNMGIILREHNARDNESNPGIDDIIRR